MVAANTERVPKQGEERDGVGITETIIKPPVSTPVARRPNHPNSHATTSRNTACGCFAATSESGSEPASAVMSVRTLEQRYPEPSTAATVSTVVAEYPGDIFEQP